MASLLPLQSTKLFRLDTRCFPSLEGETFAAATPPLVPYQSFEAGQCIHGTQRKMSAAAAHEEPRHAGSEMVDIPGSAVIGNNGVNFALLRFRLSEHFALRNALDVRSRKNSYRCSSDQQ